MVLFLLKLCSRQQICRVAATSYVVDSNGYIDTGFMNHILGKLYKLMMRDKYISGVIKSTLLMEQV